jgi:hypothetical protein
MKLSTQGKPVYGQTSSIFVFSSENQRRLVIQFDQWPRVSQHSSSAPERPEPGRMFLILDGFAGRLSDTIEEQSLFYRVVLLVIAPQTSDRLQPLDLGLFARHNMECHRVHADTDLSTSTVKILKIVCDFQKAATPLSVIKAFRRAGVTFRWDRAAEALICHIEWAGAKEIRDWNQAKSRISIVLRLRWGDDQVEEIDEDFIQ